MLSPVEDHGARLEPMSAHSVRVIAIGPIPADADDIAADFAAAQLAKMLATPIFGGTDPTYIAEDANDDALTVPNVGKSLAVAALAYAKAGMFVVPTDPADAKNPGSLLGNKWQDQSSADPEQIRAWWTDHPDAGIAWDVGRSGAVAFDLDVDRDDKPADMADDIWSALQTGAIHTTRRPGCGKDARAHYVFACQPDEFGNSAGAFGRWGQVRCSNGVLILAPTPHPDATTKSGSYRWRKSGQLPPLPDVLRALLAGAVEHEDPKTPAELTRFLTRHTDDREPHGLQGHLTAFANAVERGESRHDAMTKVMVWAFRESLIGRFPAQFAYDGLKHVFHRAKAEARGTGEFDRIARWAAAQAETADPDDTRQRVNREIDADAFWSARPALSDLRQFARARRIGPWAMLGHVLARTVSAIPPHVVLPPMTGSHASLNLFVALVGKSGAGKGGAAGAAVDWLDVDPTPFVATLGSGEGIAKCFAYKTKATGGGWNQVGLRASVLFDAPEIDNLAALTGRSASTLTPQLRSAYSGEELGFSYADPAKAVRLCRHRYRLCLTVGVQPGRGRALLDDADGGTPQRFVWLPTNDPGAPNRAPDTPAMYALPSWPGSPAVAGIVGSTGPEHMLDTPIVPNAPDAYHVLKVPALAADMIDAFRTANLRDPEAIDPLDGHRFLCRLKIAAALMAFDGRTDEVTDDDWNLSEIVMAVSDRTRQSIVDVLVSNAEAENMRRGRSEGMRADAAEQVKTDRAVARVAENVVRKLKANGGDMARSALRRMIPARDRPMFDDAETLLFESGRIEKTPVSEGRGSGSDDAYTLRLAEGSASK